jgi:hypothetical protein
MCRGTSKVSRFRLLPNDFGSPADPPVSAIAASLTKATFPAAITSGDTTPAASRSSRHAQRAVRNHRMRHAALSTGVPDMNCDTFLGKQKANRRS